jgi:hypothetical protein
MAWHMNDYANHASKTHHIHPSYLISYNAHRCSPDSIEVHRVPTSRVGEPAERPVPGQARVQRVGPLQDLQAMMANRISCGSATRGIPLSGRPTQPRGILHIPSLSKAHTLSISKSCLHFRARSHFSRASLRLPTHPSRKRRGMCPASVVSQPRVDRIDVRGAPVTLSFT